MLARLVKMFSLDSRPLFAVGVLLSVVPLWIPEFLPLVDLPQHAAQVASLKQLWSEDALFSEALTVNWFTPYLGGYLLAYGISTVLPMMAAIKLLVSMAVIGVPVVTGLLLKEIDADERLKWLAIPASYSFALYWGFMVYLVAVPVALALLWLTVRFERNPTLTRTLGIACFSTVLFFFHVIALCFCALISLTYIAARNFTTPLRLVRCALPYAAPLPLIAIWMTRVFETEVGVEESPIVFAPLGMRLTTLFAQLSGLDGAKFWTELGIASAVLLLPFLLGYRPSRRLERWLPLLVGLAVYLTFPHYMQSTAYLYQRLGVFLIPLWLMLWDAPPRTAPAFGPAIVAVVGLWFGVSVNRFAAFAQESASFGTVLARAEPGHTLAGMLVCNASERFRYPVYLHFHAWYQAKGEGIVDNSFAMTHPSMVRYRDMQLPRVGDQLAWEPAAFRWGHDGGADYDYFLVCSAADVSKALFKDHVGSVELIAHEAPWWLYRNHERARP